MGTSSCGRRVSRWRNFRSSHSNGARNGSGAQFRKPSIQRIKMTGSGTPTSQRSNPLPAAPFSSRTSMVSLPSNRTPKPGGGGGMREAAGRASRVEEARQMEEHRRGEADRVDAIHDAAVTLDHAAEVLHAAVALDRGHREAAGEAHQRDH